MMAKEKAITCRPTWASEATMVPEVPVPGSYYVYEGFDRGAQLRRLALVSLARWLVTLAFAAAIYGVLWSYSTREVMAIWRKHEFNVLVIGLSIGLGLNIASSLKAMVVQLRWWLLSLRPVTPREADLILRSEDLSCLVQLGWATPHLTVRLFVSFWLLINVISQIALAALGLTYNINPAEEIHMTMPGMVSIPNMSNIETGRMFLSNSSRINAMYYTANSYGLAARAFEVGQVSDMPRPGTVSNLDCKLTFSDDDTSSRYVFYEATPDNTSEHIAVATDRYVSVAASCESWRVVGGGDGWQGTIVVGDDVGTELVLPTLNGPDQLLFMHDPGEASGDRWSVVTAFEASTTDPWFYRCNVSIGAVVNAAIKEHEIGANVSRLAAPAIALQGYGASTRGVGESARQYQFQSYPVELVYPTRLQGDTMRMQFITASFASGVIAMTAKANPAVVVPGLVPTKGIELEITGWDTLYYILGLTIGLQLSLAAASVLVANRVQVRHQSHLAMATLLRPVLRRLPDGASAASGRQAAAMLGPGARLSYGPEASGGYSVRIDEGRRRPEL